MFETPVTVVGRLVNDVTTRVVTTGDKVANFRIACQERRYDKELGVWADGDRMYVSVSCWRRAADGAAALAKGDQVVVHGRLRLEEYQDEDGRRRTNLKVDARALGADLAFHTVLVNRPSWGSTPGQLALVNAPPGLPSGESGEVIDAA